MPRLVLFLVVLMAGFALGVVFYAGLWATLRALPASRHPVPLALGSFLGRTAVVITGFLLMTARRWQNALLCLAGFVLARIALGRWVPHAPAGRRAQ